MIDLKIEEQLFQKKEISFALPLSDPRIVAGDLSVDSELQHGGDRYFIYRAKNTLDKDGKRLRLIWGEINWMKLADIKKAGDFVLEDQTHGEGLSAILDGSGWALGNVDASLTGTFSYDATDPNTLGLVWTWCRITGCEPQFDSQPKLIHLLTSIGVDSNVSFRYGRDLLELEKEERSPVATRLYGFGKDDLSVVAIAGNSYVEDYSWYTAQGITEAYARAEFQKDDIFSDVSFIDDQALYDEVIRRLAVTSKPTISYKGRVADISEIAGYDARFKTGDTARIYDQEVDQDLSARVTRKISFPHDPSKNTVELSFNPVGLPDITSSTSRSSHTQSWELFVNTNDVVPREIRAFSTIIHRTKLRHVEGAEWVMGYSLSGIGVGASEVTIEFTDDETDLPIWPSLVIDVTDGEIVEHKWTVGRKDIPAGTTTVVVRAFSDTSGAGLDIDLSRTNSWVLARGTTRQTFTLPNSVTYNFTGAIQTWEVPDDVFEVLIDCKGSKGKGGVGGNGGQASCRYQVVPGTIYDVYVGGRDGIASTIGWPNGGRGGLGGGSGNAGWGGGGSTHLIPQGGGIAAALLVAPGGGGSAEFNVGGYGGFFIGTDGEDGNASGGHGATQVAGGTGGAGSGGGAGLDGTFGEGGRGGDASAQLGDGGAGGGGGLFGGGGGGATGAVQGDGEGGGGGGAGFVGPGGYDLEYNDDSNSGEGIMVLSWETPEEV